MTLGDILSIASRKYPKKTALVHGETRLSFGEINERVNRLAYALQALGVNRGDRIALRAKNCTQCIEFFFCRGKVWRNCRSDQSCPQGTGIFLHDS